MSQEQGYARRETVRRSRSGSPSGYVLNVYKEISWTSHDAVARLRGVLKTRRVGHAGTLDPLANGVLAVGVGRATKLLPHLVELPKTYRGTLRLGVRTASGDGGGKIVETGPIPDLDQAAIQLLAEEFEGGYLQTPPMVSAVKQGGKRLYQLARKGLVVPREPRPVRIDRFTILEVDFPRIDFEVRCGRGTYVRTLVEDLAERMGTVAAIESLTRTAIGPFSIENSVRLISLPGTDRTKLLSLAIPMGEAVRHLPKIEISSLWAGKLRHGVLPPARELSLSPDLVGSAVRLMGPKDEFVAIGRVTLAQDQEPVLKLEKVF